MRRAPAHAAPARGTESASVRRRRRAEWNSTGSRAEVEPRSERRLLADSGSGVVANSFREDLLQPCPLSIRERREIIGAVEGLELALEHVVRGRSFRGDPGQTGPGELAVANRPWHPVVLHSVDEALVAGVRRLAARYPLFMRERPVAGLDRAEPLVQQIECPQSVRCRGTRDVPRRIHGPALLPPVHLVGGVSVRPQEAEAGEDPLRVVVHLVVVVRARIDDRVLAQLQPVGDEPRLVHALDAGELAPRAAALVIAIEIEAADLLVEIDELLRRDAARP